MDGVTVIAGQTGATVKLREPGQPLASVAVMVKVALVVLFGVPEITPDEVFSVAQPGRLPVVTANVYEAAPPVAVMVWL